MKKIFCIIGSMLMLWACSNSNMTGQEVTCYYEDFAEAPMMTKRMMANTESTQNVETKLVRTASIDFQTNDAEKSKEHVYQCIREFGAVVDNEHLTNNPKSIRYSIYVRVPAQHLDSFLIRLETGAMMIDTKNIAQEDVTTRHIDLETRLNNKKELEKKYQQLLAQTNKIEDILSIEREMNQIRSEIESTTKQLDYLNQQIAYSSCNITFYQLFLTDIHNGSLIGNALRDGGNNLVSFLLFLLRIWPFVIIAVAVGIYIAVKRRKRRQK